MLILLPLSILKLTFPERLLAETLVTLPDACVMGTGYVAVSAQCKQNS